MMRSQALAPTRRSFFALLLLAELLLFTLALAAYTAMYPDASGVDVYDQKSTVLDASNAAQGYIMVKHDSSDKKVKLRISLGKASETYDLATDGEYAVFPLTGGSGKYSVQVFQQVSGKKYSSETSFKLKVTIDDTNLMFLYPNIYVDYTADSAAVVKGAELCAGLSSDADKLNAVYEYVTKHVVYDHVRALTVESGYIPDIDSVLAEQKGICFDYSALVACMLRSQGVPTKMIFGYADRCYHAWNEVLIDGEWQRIDATSAASGLTVKKYTDEHVY